MQTQNSGLLFIPDISGFTHFVNQTDIKHSQLIIQELLEIIINSNALGLEISEVEGDAVLFYKFGQPPKLPEIYQQVETMFRTFHKALIAYNQQKYCQCKACLAAAGLSLKIITHYGEFANYQVQHFKKLIGKDVIAVHQLLKNEVPHHEYWLVTKNLTAEAPDLHGLSWNSSTKQVEGELLQFHYAYLSHLKDDLVPDPIPPLNLSGKTKVISISREYESNLIKMFHATGDFSYRSRWREGVKEVQELTHYLPRIGMRCRIVLESGEEVISVNSFTFDEEKIQFAEVNDSNQDTTVYTLIPRGENHTALTVEHFKNNDVAISDDFRKNALPKLEESFRTSMDNLESLLEQIEYSYP